MPDIWINNKGCITKFKKTEVTSVDNTINLLAFLKANQPDVDQYAEAHQSLLSVLKYWNDNGETIVVPRTELD